MLGAMLGRECGGKLEASPKNGARAGMGGPAGTVWWFGVLTLRSGRGMDSDGGQPRPLPRGSLELLRLEEEWMEAVEADPSDEEPVTKVALAPDCALDCLPR